MLMYTDLNQVSNIPSKIMMSFPLYFEPTFFYVMQDGAILCRSDMNDIVSSWGNIPSIQLKEVNNSIELLVHADEPMIHVN